MFGSRQSKTIEIPTEEPAAAVAAAGVEPSRHAALLERWMALADMQQRVIATLMSEITHTSSFVETEADALSQRFQRLALSAEEQTSRVESLTHLAVDIEVEGETVRIDHIAGLLEETLSDVVEKILMLSKDSMSMVYALNELSENVDRVDSCMVKLSSINKTTNMLALNARIEAERAGTAGAAFRVVAQEVRELSKATADLSVSMQNELNTVTAGIANGRETLQRVATIDMSQNILAKDRLEVLLAALLRRSESLNRIVSDAFREAGLISGDVESMVTGIQFQDRTKQRLEHVVDTLGVISEALDEIKASTAADVPELAGRIEPDVAWVKKLLDRFKLSDMRARFVSQVLDGQTPDDPSGQQVQSLAPSSSGSIELF